MSERRPIAVLTIGPLHWELGLEYAICAVAEARRRGVDVRYDIVGSGADRERVVYTAMDVGLADVVRLHEPGRDIRARLAAADVVLWPHLFGASSTAADVAARERIPLVTTVAMNGARVVGVRDVDALASALIHAAGETRMPTGRTEIAEDEVDAMAREARCASS